MNGLTTKSSVHNMPTYQNNYGQVFDAIPETPENFRHEIGFSTGSNVDLDAI